MGRSTNVYAYKPDIDFGNCTSNTDFNRQNQTKYTQQFFSLQNEISIADSYININIDSDLTLEIHLMEFLSSDVPSVCQLP